jgi:hypothetical protein
MNCFQAIPPVENPDLEKYKLRSITSEERTMTYLLLTAVSRNEWDLLKFDIKDKKKGIHVVKVMY